LITVVMSRVIEADPQQVWKALIDPAVITAWDARVLAPVDPGNDYPFSGGVRWRYQLGRIQVVMHDRPLEVIPGTRLKRRIRLGSLRYEQTLSLTPIEGQPGHTNLGIKIVTPNWIPLVGETIDRFSARELATQHVDDTLRQIQTFFAQTDRG
jgi:hypothetical protein